MEKWRDVESRERHQEVAFEYHSVSHFQVSAKLADQGMLPCKLVKGDFIGTYEEWVCQFGHGKFEI